MCVCVCVCVPPHSFDIPARLRMKILDVFKISLNTTYSNVPFLEEEEECITEEGWIYTYYTTCTHSHKFAVSTSIPMFPTPPPRHTHRDPN